MKLLGNLCAHVRGRRGEKKPSNPNLDLVDAIDGVAAGQELKKIAHKRVLAAAQEISQQRMQLELSGDPAADWIAVRKLLDASACAEIKQIATECVFRPTVTGRFGRS